MKLINNAMKLHNIQWSKSFIDSMVRPYIILYIAILWMCNCGAYLYICNRGHCLYAGFVLLKFLFMNDSNARQFAYKL